MADNRPMEDRLYYIETQTINLDELEIQGKILDIGGGGEGVIGQSFCEQVVAIDPSKEELEETAKGPLKVIMDARDLKFLDYSFDNVTSFFTMMYIPSNEHEKVISEIYRVLKPGGEFYIWDVVIPPFIESIKDIYVVPLQIKLKEKIIETGYGIKWKNKEQTASYYIDICERVGFKVIDNISQRKTFFIKFKKINNR